MSALTDHIMALADCQRVGLRIEDEQVRFDELFAQACTRSAAIDAHVRRGPRHLGVLLPNSFEAMFWLTGGLLAGVPVVGLNSTRRGKELADDVRHTECDLVVTDADGSALLDDAGVGTPRWIIGTDQYQDHLAPFVGAPAPSAAVPDDRVAALIFTSGTTSAPKAAIRRHGSLAQLSGGFVDSCSITSADVAYNAMPWFHSNALYHAVIPTLISRGTLVLRSRFSASQFIHDARRHGVTRFNYVGKVLEYILATPERPDDLDNSIRLASGSEASERDIEEFTRRFGVFVRDGFGSTEGGVTVIREPGMPRGALGVATDETIVVMNPDTDRECPRAVFDAQGVLTNGSEAIGELVNTAGAGSFEGYFANDEATALRTRHGWYWSGDLAYRDEAGYFYFAGRGYDWLHMVDENYAAAPIERIAMRYPNVVLASVYAVPDPNTGDQVMLALQLSDGSAFDADDFERFLSTQNDLGTKWRPRFVRIVAAMPVGHTHKIQKPLLHGHAWLTDDPVWWRPGNTNTYRRLSAADVESLHQAFVSAGRLPLAPIPEPAGEPAPIIESMDLQKEPT